MKTREPHGTLEAWRDHRRNGTHPCPSCQQAYAWWQQAQDRAATADAWRQLLDLIAGECRRAGLLPC